MFYVHISALQGKGLLNVWAALDDVSIRNYAAALVQSNAYEVPAISHWGIPVARVDEPGVLFPDWLLLENAELKSLFGEEIYVVVDVEESARIGMDAAGAVFKTREEAQNYCWDSYLDSLVKSNPDEDPGHNDCFDLVCSDTGTATSSKGVLNWLQIVQL